MDCRNFRRHHLAYLDDTLSGDQTSEAQRHLLSCDGCAAHDTLVRRSLMMARSLPAIEPTADFQRRLRDRLAACRDEPMPQASRKTLGMPVFEVSRPIARTFAAVAAGTALGLIAWNGFSSPDDAELIAMQPVVASEPALRGNPYITPALMQAMSTGNPVWPATMLLEDAPSSFVMATYNLAEEIR
ncbi:MAG TPA: zf-HC2 domain-containing protein [Gemmatimonas sp.]|nr:zf-HC2 domain-containing protein [Gemmatimonas sp.]